MLYGPGCQARNSDQKFSQILPCIVDEWIQLQLPCSLDDMFIRKGVCFFMFFLYFKMLFSLYSLYIELNHHCYLILQMANKLPQGHGRSNCVTSVSGPVGKEPAWLDFYELLGSARGA